MRTVHTVVFWYTLLLLDSTSAVIQQEFPFPTLLPWVGVHLPKNSSSQENQCREDSKILKESFERRLLWAVKMVDASARSVSGALWGSRHQLGSFDGCLSAGETSPVGARYCLAEVTVKHASAQAPPPGWLSAEDLQPDLDAAAVFNGEGQAPGFHPPGEVLVAQCVPLSCEPAALQAALRAAGVRGTVPPQLCAHREQEGERMRGLFWLILALLMGATVAAPFLGWSWWDWRRHLRALGRPDPLLDGMDLAPLSGIRFLTAVFMTGVHRGGLEVYGAASNQIITRRTLRLPLNTMVFHGDIFNATFFFISGLLTILCKSRHGVLRSLLIRFFRLVPVYLLMMFFISVALPDMGVAPLWNHLIGRESRACKRRWWINMLFMNNYAPLSEEDRGCMFQTWYLAVEMQLFLVSLLLRPEARGWRALLVALLLSMLPPFLGTLYFRWSALIPLRPLEMESVYDDPWFKYSYVPMHMNATPFVVGLISGKLLQHLKRVQGFRLSPRTTWTLMVSSTATVVASLLSCLVLLDPDRPYSALESALYDSLITLVWGGALAALMVALVFGEPTWIHSFLSWQPMVTLSRLTYALYLTSYIFQTAVVAAQMDSSKTTTFTVVYHAGSDVLWCFFISFALHMILEAPARVITKEFLDRTVQKSHSQDPSTTTHTKKEM